MIKLQFYLIFVTTLVVCSAGSRNVLHTSKLYKKILQLRSLPYEDCGSQFGIVYVKISSCSTIPCEMFRGSTVLVQTIFDDYGSNTEFLKHSVRWIFNAVKTEATISPDPCNGHDACISNELDGKSYWASVYVNTTLPVMRGTMLWEAGDATTKNLICFKVPVNIKLGW